MFSIPKSINKTNRTIEKGESFTIQLSFVNCRTKKNALSCFFREIAPEGMSYIFHVAAGLKVLYNTGYERSTFMTIYFA